MARLRGRRRKTFWWTLSITLHVGFFLVLVFCTPLRDILSASAAQTPPPVA